MTARRSTAVRSDRISDGYKIPDAANAEPDNPKEEGYRRKSGRNEAARGIEWRNTKYENDRTTGRNQERDDFERYDRRHGRPEEWRTSRSGDWSPGYSGDWGAGSGSCRTARGSSWGYTRNQEYYSPYEWQRKNNEARTTRDYPVEKDDVYRPPRNERRRQFTRQAGKNIEGLRKLLEDQLKDMYGTEKALISI